MVSLQIVIDAILLAGALLSLYVGGRRLALKGRGAVGLLLAGVAMGATQAAPPRITGQYETQMAVLADMVSGRQHKSLDENWGQTLTNEARAERSQMYARVAFDDSGKLLEYFDKSGARRLFVPTQDQIQKRETMLIESSKVAGQMGVLRDFNYKKGVTFLVSMLVALAAGTFAGSNARKALS